MKKITPAQRKKIYATAREIGMDNDLLHGVVEELTKKEHISDLTIAQAARVIDHITMNTDSRRFIDLPTGRKVAMATQKQMWKVQDLEEKLGWKDNPKRLRGFCRKYAGVDNPDWMTKEQAKRIIEGLKSLLKQQGQTPGGGENGKLRGAALDK